MITGAFALTENGYTLYIRIAALCYLLVRRMQAEAFWLWFSYLCTGGCRGCSLCGRLIPVSLCPRCDCPLSIVLFLVWLGFRRVRVVLGLVVRLW